jgi:hypothetical protein
MACPLFAELTELCERAEQEIRDGLASDDLEVRNAVVVMFAMIVALYDQITKLIQERERLH